MNEKISGQRGRGKRKDEDQCGAKESKRPKGNYDVFFGLTPAYNVRSLCDLFDVEDSTVFHEAKK